MSWEETRGSAHGAVGASRQLAHADDAKSRVDESSRLPTKSLRPRVLTAVGAVVAVLVLVAFLALRGGLDDDVDRAALVDEVATPSATPSEPTPAEVLAESQPSGDWKLVIFNRTLTQRDGTTRPNKGKSDPATWTFPAAACSDAQCSGSITSSSGREFPFTWDGEKLRVTRPETTERDKKRACIDEDTGQVMPIQESAARATWHYSLNPFVGSAEQMTSKAVTRVTFEFFGTCTPSPTDEVRGDFEWVMTRIN
jgi:hypothetical protein